MQCQFFVTTADDYIEVVDEDLGRFEFTAPPATSQDDPLESLIFNWKVNE